MTLRKAGIAIMALLILNVAQIQYVSANEEKKTAALGMESEKKIIQKTDAGMEPDPNAVKKSEVKDTEKSIVTAGKIFSFDPLKRKDKDEKKWIFSLGAWFSMFTGNTETLNTNGAFNLEYDDGIANGIISYKGFYGVADGILSEHSHEGAIDFDYFVMPRLEIFVFTNGEYNQMNRLEFRNNTGLGLKFVAFKNKYWLTDISAAPVFQYEKYYNIDEAYDARLSFRYKIIITPIKYLSFKLTFFYIPKITDFTAYRTVLDTYIQIKLFDIKCDEQGLFFNIGYTHKYNENAVYGTKKLDQKLYAGLQVKI